MHTSRPPAQGRRSRAFVSLLGLVTLTASCGGVDGSATEDLDASLLDQNLSSEERIYDRLFEHSLHAAPISNGKRAVADTMDDLKGGRYVVGHSAYQHGEDEPEVRWSGVRAERLRKVPEGERNYKPARSRAAKPIVGPVLSRRLAVQDSGRVRVRLSLERPVGGRYIDQLNVALAHREVIMDSDEKAFRADFVEERQDRVRDSLDGFTSELASIDARVEARCHNSACIILDIAARDVPRVAGLPGVRSVLEVPKEPPSDAGNINGKDVIEGTQIYRNFIWNGSSSYYFDGSIATTGRGYPLYMAILENAGPNDEHYGFRTGPGTATRFASKFYCSNFTCPTVSAYTGAQESDHATAVAGIAVGDLRDGQDPAYTSESDRNKRGGYSHETSIHYFTSDDTGPEWTTMLDTMMGVSPAPEVANFSVGWPSLDPNCTGDDVSSEAVDELFEDGILPIVAAGNAGTGTSTDCRLNSPATAQGAFTVGSHTNTPDNAWDVRTQPISTFSSAGGTMTEGEGRTIVDITAPGWRHRLFTSYDSGANAYSSESDLGTSFSAPTVAAGAIDFIDWYRSLVGGDIGDPGLLFANLLLMGDRQDMSGKHIIKYNRMYGAGRLKMRKFDAAGMDGPWGWGDGWTCVGDGETVDITINGGATISSDVEDFKAVAYWYDNTGSIDDVDLAIVRTDGVAIRRSQSSYDNKERVYYDGIGGNAIKLELLGYDITDDDAGCGTNSMKVYYAWFYEDDDRESGEDLSWCDPE